MQSVVLALPIAPAALDPFSFLSLSLSAARSRELRPVWFAPSRRKKCTPQHLKFCGCHIASSKESK